MNKKRISTFLVALTFLMAMLLSFTACSAKNGQNGSDRTTAGVKDVKNPLLNSIITSDIHLGVTDKESPEDPEEPSEPGEMKFALSQDGSYYTVTGMGDCIDTDIVIPEEYEGKPVKAIGSYAFSSKSKITSVTIPETVTKIGRDAFYNCQALTKVYITSIEKWCGISFETIYSTPLYRTATGLDVTYVPVELYVNGELLTELNLTNSVSKISDWAFCGYNLLESVSLSGVTNVGDFAFYGCVGLESVTLSESVRSLGYMSFACCEQLSEMVIPEGTEEINHYAFYCCKSLEKVKIPSSVSTIGEFAFDNCVSLKEISTATSNTAYKSLEGNLYTIDGKTLLQYATGKTETEFAVPAGVENISDWACARTKNLSRVVLPASVKHIGDYAFAMSEVLVKVEATNTLETIGAFAFKNNINLKEITLGAALAKVGRGAFDKCISLTDVYYSAPREKWSSINIDSYNNSYFTGATRHYS